MAYFKRFAALFLCIAIYICAVACNNKSVDLSNDSFTSDDVSEYSSVASSGDGSEELSDSSEEYSTFSSEDSVEDFTSEETSEDVIIDRFTVLSPDVEFNKVLENGKMEMYNTDFRMSDELMNKLTQQFSSFSNAQSVALIELDTNMAFCYSKDTKIGTASAIKAPLGLFVYKCVDDGIIGWDTVKTYQQWHFQANSTGWVKYTDFGTPFTVKTLVDYMIRISDNQAYLMLKELVGPEEFEQMMAELGSTRIIPKGGNWGDITAWEMASAWREIYYYSQHNDNGAELLDRFMHAQYNYIWQAIPQYEAAHKSGWSGRAFNDAGIVYADGHEYVLVVLLARSGLKDQTSHYQFNRITQLLAELMVEYNAYLDGDAETSSVESIE